MTPERRRTYLSLAVLRDVRAHAKPEDRTALGDIVRRLEHRGFRDPERSLNHFRAEVANALKRQRDLGHIHHLSGGGWLPGPDPRP